MASGPMGATEENSVVGDRNQRGGASQPYVEDQRRAILYAEK